MRYSCLMECGKSQSGKIVKMCSFLKSVTLDSSSSDAYHRAIYPKVERILSDFEFCCRFGMVGEPGRRRISDYMRSYYERQLNFSEWALTNCPVKESSIDLSSKEKVLQCDLLKSLEPVGHFLVEIIPDVRRFCKHSLGLHDVYHEPGLISALRNVNSRLAKTAFCRELESGRSGDL